MAANKAAATHSLIDRPADTTRAGRPFLDGCCEPDARKHRGEDELREERRYPRIPEPRWVAANIMGRRDKLPCEGTHGRLTACGGQAVSFVFHACSRLRRRAGTAIQEGSVVTNAEPRYAASRTPCRLRRLLPPLLSTTNEPAGRKLRVTPEARDQLRTPPAITERCAPPTHAHGQGWSIAARRHLRGSTGYNQSHTIAWQSGAPPAMRVAMTILTRRPPSRRRDF